jgi:DNA-binding NarL/FixJ family response regulator
MGVVVVKILIVDDSQFFQGFLKKLFHNYLPEAVLLTANNGRDAYALYEQERPEFVITDLLMPEMNGQEFLQVLKESNPQVKVIVISADIQKATRREIEKMGALAFFNKPLNNEKAGELLALLKEGSYA